MSNACISNSYRAGLNMLTALVNFSTICQPVSVTRAFLCAMELFECKALTVLYVALLGPGYNFIY